MPLNWLPNEESLPLLRGSSNFQALVSMGLRRCPDEDERYDEEDASLQFPRPQWHGSMIRGVVIDGTVKERPGFLHVRDFVMRSTIIWNVRVAKRRNYC